LKAAFPKRVWVVGETAELERGLHRQHWFFRLVEKEAADGKRYALGAVIWGFDQKRLFGPGGTLAGVLEPKDGVEIRACVDVDFYGPNGDLRLVVRDIDPAYTLGKLALERQQLIEKLTKEGVLTRQKALATPELPLRIGVISSENSAAANDFLKEIARFGFAFEILFFDARMQGEDTVSTVSRGLRALQRRGVDAIALVRGGGSTIDLAWFDKEALVRAIAACRVPVFTGIGHEIDTSVADLAAHLSFKTPTAVAAWFNERALEALSTLREAHRRLVEIGERPQFELDSLSITARRVADLVGAAVREQQAHLAAARSSLVKLPGALVRLERERVAAAARRLRTVPINARVRVETETLARARRAVGRAANDELDRAAQRLQLAATRVRLIDPANVVRRGFAILRDARGRVLKDAAMASPGDRVTATMRDGDLAARVEKSPRGDAPRTKPPTGGQDGETKDGPGGGPRQLAIW
jgi:exodeoxyribonuclease VII large subunit